MSQSDGRALIMPYTELDTGLVDSRGQRICFSTKRGNIDIENMNSINIESDGVLNQTFYNGRWRMY